MDTTRFVLPAVFFCLGIGSTYAESDPRLYSTGAYGYDYDYGNNGWYPDPYDIIMGDLNISFYVQSVTEVQERKGLITLKGVFVLEWQGPSSNFTSDYKLTHNKTKYKSSEMSWIYNSVKLSIPNSRMQNDGEFLESMRVTHHENGHVIGVVDYESPSTCSFDLTNFPSDTQNCYLDIFSSNTKANMSALDVGYLGDLEGNAMFTEVWLRSAWELENISISEVTLDWFIGSKYHKVYQVDPLKFVRIKVQIKRSSDFFHKVYITPIALVLLTPIIFLLPPDSDQKLIYGALLLLIQYQTSTNLEQVFPTYVDKTPYIVQLMSSCGALIFSCLFLSAILSSIERVGREKPLPAFVKRYIIGCIGPVLCVKDGEESQNTVHISSMKLEDQAKILDHEQLSENCSNQNGGDTISSDILEQNTAIMSLVHELKLARYHKRHNEQWLNFFTVINRALFLIMMLVGIILLFCFIGV